MKYLLPFAFLFFISTRVQSQTVLSNNPASLRWFQINTPHFRVLFPKGFDEQAQRMANTLEHIHAGEARSLGSTPKKISVILQNQSSVSNGFVSILPRRSEFYAMPSQNYNFTGTNDWLNLLASHEYRHIVQYQHATRGFNKVLYYLFGATTLAGMAQAAAPMWFWEGDAVATETAFTPSGRGKIPNFSLLFKTNLLEGREFNYHKQYLRSYRHNIPDHYVLGFHMVSYLRKRTNDPDIWGKISARSWNVPFIPFAFSNAIKKETGMYVTSLYKDMAKDLKAEWEKEISTLAITPFERINQRKAKAYVDYEFPQVLEDGSVLVMKKGIGEIEKFVLIKDGKEKKVFIPGFINESGMLSVEDNKVVWNEYGYDPRWPMRNYSLVKAFDLNKKRKTVLGSKHNRLGSAALSPDGKRVATIQTSIHYKTQLVILDFGTGQIIQEFDNPENYFFSMPRWSDDAKKIIVLKTTPQGKTITQVDIETKIHTDLLPVTQENYGHPVIVGEYVLYNSPVSGIDNIYALNIPSGEKLQVTSSRYGAYNPSVSKDGKVIYYNEQTKNGLDVVKISFDPSSWKSFVAKQDPTHQYSHLVEQEGDPKLFSTIPQQELPVRKYSKLRGIFNPYTWGLNVDSDLTQAKIGIASRDLLSTTSVDLGLVYDINERTSAWQANVSYQGLYPIIDVTTSIANRKVDEGEIDYQRVIGNDTLAFRNNLTFEWKEISVQGGIRIPLNLTTSRYSSNVTLSNYVGYTSVSDFTNTIDGGGRIVPAKLPQYFFRNYADHGALLYNQFSLTAYRLLKQSHRDINSRFGQRIIINASNTPYGGDYSGKQFSLYGILYFPGISKHHSLWGYWAYQFTDISLPNLATGEGLNNYLFRNRIPLPRGHSVNRLTDFYSMSANYTLPLWYPDIALGPVLNVQRLRANLFADYGYGVSKKYEISRSYTSVGVEAKVDINIMRFFPQFDIGVRFTKGLQPSTSVFEVLIGTFNF